MMKLNQECVRDLLLTLEEEFSVNDSADSHKISEMSRLKNYDKDEVTYTIVKCEEAGFINAEIVDTFDGVETLVLVFPIMDTNS